MPRAAVPLPSTCAVTSAISAAGVGVPTWSATTFSSSRCAPTRSIVRRKLLPCEA